MFGHGYLILQRVEVDLRGAFGWDRTFTRCSMHGVWAYLESSSNTILIERCNASKLTIHHYVMITKWHFQL